MEKKHEILTGVITGILLAVIGWAWNLEGRMAHTEIRQQYIIENASRSDIERKDLIKSFNNLNTTVTEFRVWIELQKERSRSGENN